MEWLDPDDINKLFDCEEPNIYRKIKGTKCIRRTQYQKRTTKVTMTDKLVEAMLSQNKDFTYSDILKICGAAPNNKKYRGGCIYATEKLERLGYEVIKEYSGKRKELHLTIVDR